MTKRINKGLVESSNFVDLSVYFLLVSLTSVLLFITFISTIYDVIVSIHFFIILMTLIISYFSFSFIFRIWKNSTSTINKFLNYNIKKLLIFGLFLIVVFYSNFLMNSFLGLNFIADIKNIFGVSLLSIISSILTS